MRLEKRPQASGGVSYFLLTDGKTQRWSGLSCDWMCQSVQLEQEDGDRTSPISAVSIVCQREEDFWTGRLPRASCSRPVDCVISANHIIELLFWLLNFLPNCSWLVYTGARWMSYVIYFKLELKALFCLQTLADLIPLSDTLGHHVVITECSPLPWFPDFSFLTQEPLGVTLLHLHDVCVHSLWSSSSVLCQSETTHLSVRLCPLWKAASWGLIVKSKSDI